MPIPSSSLKQLTPNDFPGIASKNSNLGVNIWDVLSGTIGQPSGLFTNSAYNLIKDLKDPKQGIGQKIYDATIKDNLLGSLYQGVKNGVNSQVADWKDGKFTWGDIPGVGLLHGMDTGWKRGSDIMSELGVNNRWGNVGGGLGIDTLLDPLTYLTGGLSAASKLGKVAEASKMTELAGNLGLDASKFKNVGDFTTAAKDAIQAGHAQSIDNVANTTREAYAHLPNLVDDMVTRNVENHQALLQKQLDGTINDYTTQINAARNQAINSHINDWGFSIPFTNKFAKVGEYKPNSLLHSSESLVPKETVDSLISKGANGNQQLHDLITEAVKARYGVEDTGQLTKTMHNDLHSFIQPVIDRATKSGLPDAKVIQKVVDHVMPQEDFAKLMNNFRQQNIKWDVVKNQLNDILTQTGHDPKLRASFGSHLAQMVSDYWAHTTTGMRGISKADRAARAESMKWASDFLKGSDKYQTVDNTIKDFHPKGNPAAKGKQVEYALTNKKGTGALDKMHNTPYDKLGDFHTKIGHAVRGKNPFDARSLATGNKFVDSMGEHIADANSQRVGETARYSRGMDKIVNYVKKFEKGGGDKQQLMEHAIYTLEKHAPDHLGGKDFVPSKDATNLANLIKPLLDRVGGEEQKAGVLDKLRSNYFPHVVNHDPKAIKDMEDFAKRHPELNGLKSTSKFNKERTSFQTLAQRDNYLASIEKAISKETDPGKIEALREQQDRVSHLFDTNVVSALQRRIKEGVRAKAMKEMQTTLSKYGMMKTIIKGSENTHIPNGLEEIPADQAKKLGLGAGRHYIHPEVLKGMKRVDEIFTSEGMNKYVRHMTALADVWRPLVTFYKPSHYVNNIIGNIINNMAAGVKASDYKAAGKLILGYKNGTLTEDQMKIIEQAYKHNVISGGFLYDSHATFHHDDPSKLEKLAKVIADNKAIKSTRHKMGELPDDISRMANFINGINKYGKTEEAAKQVRTYLFNYNELTNADRTMRVLVPFWNWTKRNVPLQMKLLMQNPKFAMNNYRVMQLFNDKEHGAGWQKDSGLHVPQPIANLINGGTNQEYYTTYPTPVTDLGLPLNPSQLMGSLTPSVKMPIEMALNKKFFTGKPISYGSSSLQPKDVPSYVASNLGIGGNMFDAVGGNKTPLESLVNFFHSISKVNMNNPNGG